LSDSGGYAVYVPGTGREPGPMAVIGGAEEREERRRRASSKKSLDF
jgi:hypothetical protein